MNGKLYTANLATLANSDGAGATPADTENRILVKWADALSLGDSHDGLDDYRLWQVILVLLGGDYMDGVPLQRIVHAVAEVITGQSVDRGLNIYELAAIAAEVV